MEFSSQNELFKYLNNRYVGTQGKSASSFSFIRIPTPIEIILSIQETPIVPYIAFSQDNIIKKP